jgi:hypothetical protein
MISLISAFKLDRSAPRHIRMHKRRLALLITFIGTVIALVGPQNTLVVRIFVAISSLAFVSYVWRSLLECLYLSLYRTAKKSGISYWTEFSKRYSLFDTPFAGESMLRMGLVKNDIPNPNQIKSIDIFTDNLEFRKILEQKGITKDIWTGVWSWMEEKEHSYIESSFILSDEAVSRMSGIGVSWSYGKIPHLTKMGKEVFGLSRDADRDNFYEQSVHLFENSILKSTGANAIVVAQSADDAREFIEVSASTIHLGTAPHDLLHKRIFEIDTEALIAIKDPEVLARTLSVLCVEAINAGNIILVIPHAPALVVASHAIGYDSALTLSEYMINPELHIVLLSDRHGYHATLETESSIMQATDKIELDALSGVLLRSVAKKEVLHVEYSRKVVFSFAGITAIILAVERFVPERLHDGLRDYLDECALYAHTLKQKYITLQIAQQFIAEKSGTKNTVADGSMSGEKSVIRETITNRVKGQEKAVHAVISALERIQSGLGRTNKPLATFLFLGPTGVGKTETAKALAESYFGTEDKIVRFDMSEYSDINAVPRLIGSFERGEVGLLVAKARDSAHGVILFDELEKAHPKVQDLMLQILDEGYFTDARGETVNMKNFIIVATSNAGTDIKEIIAKGIFKPEFLNRFDEIAIYEPLGLGILAQVAQTKLEAYAKDLYDKKAIHMTISPELISFVVGQIGDNSFGARKIQRIIQDHVESLIARDIIRRVALSGSTVSFVYNNQFKNLETVYAK